MGAALRLPADRDEPLPLRVLAEPEPETEPEPVASPPRRMGLDELLAHAEVAKLRALRRPPADPASVRHHGDPGELHGVEVIGAYRVGDWCVVTSRGTADRLLLFVSVGVGLVEVGTAGRVRYSARANERIQGWAFEEA